MRRRLRRPGRLGPGFVPFAAAMRSLGAIAHFDPSWGATDDGTTSTWIDRVGGYTVASTSQATRLVYSGSLAGLNNRPGWTGSLASLTKLTGAASLAGLLDVAANYSVYQVRKSSSVATGQLGWCIGSTSLTQYVYEGDTITTGASAAVRRNAGTDAATSLVQSGTTAKLSVAIFDGSSQKVYTNGSLAVSVASTMQPTCDLFVVGALYSAGAYSFQYSGDLGDIIIFPTAHTDAQRRYVEQLIAAKYGWACIQGVSGFTAPNFLETGVNLGIRGASGVGVWADYFMRWDAIPGSEYVGVASAGVTGHTCYTSAGNQHFRVGNNTALFVSPGATVAASDVGKALLFGGCSDLSFARAFKNGAEVGAGTACAGYTADATTKYQISDGLPAGSMTLFGVAGGNVPQTAGDQAARAAAIKAANGFVHTGGATPAHAWKIDGLASSYADLVGSDSLNLTAGQLAAAQIIIPTWPW